MNELCFEVIDDSGFLALVDPDAYASFVHENWNYLQLVEHFKAEMSVHQLLIWQTGMENTWKVEISFAPLEMQGFKELTGFIHVSKGRLLLTNYESLTMAAQFEDVILPEPHEKNLLLSVPTGFYQCRIPQIHNPISNHTHQYHNPDFAIELIPSNDAGTAWAEIP